MNKKYLVIGVYKDDSYGIYLFVYYSNIEDAEDRVADVKERHDILAVYALKITDDAVYKYPSGDRFKVMLDYIIKGAYGNV